MKARYRVERLKLQSGERLSLLLDSATGVPLWDATLFILTELRATNLASATIDQAARSVLVVHQIFDHLGIDLNARIASGNVLTLSELDALAQLAGLPQHALNELPYQSQQWEVASKATLLEKVRMDVSSNKVPPQVASETKAVRLLYIRSYIAWVSRRKLLKLDLRKEANQAILTTAQWMLDALAERVPSSSHKNPAEQRQGLSPEIRARVLEVIDPDSPENPWPNLKVRKRNHLIVRWLIHLGLRKGELLGVYVSDINFRTGEANIVRRADNPLDSRKDEARVKTKGRMLVLGDALESLTRDYVMRIRSSIPGARRHPYLFVANGTGAPLSASAVSKLFRELRTKVPRLPEELCPHVLRHTWNDDFSELMDAQGVSPEEEEALRKQAMGWSDGSKMAAHYTRRHVQRKANEASLSIQNASFKLPPKK